MRIEYETPGKKPAARTLAALGTRFDREEDAVYLIGAEPAPDGTWRRPVPWKLDRVRRLLPLPSERNPDPSAYPSHRLLGETPGEAAAVSRLDVERLFADSVGGFYETDADGGPRLRLVVDRCYEEEMVNRLLRLGDAFTVVAPPSLVTRLLEKIRGIERRHASPHG